MHAVHPSNRGQVLIIFVFAILGLIGVTGLAIDATNILSDRRHAQNAADTAALAAALTRVNAEKGGASEADCINISGGGTCGLAVLNAAQNMVSRNGYDWGDLTHVAMEIHTPPIDGTYSHPSFTYDRNDYVQVILTTHVETFFAKVLGRNMFDNRVEAVALALYQPQSSLYGGNSLVELRPASGSTCGSGGGGGGGGDVYLGGTSKTILNGGGLFVNSINPGCALKIRDSGDPTCSSIVLSGGAKITGLGGEDSTCSPHLMQPATKGYPYPPIASPVSPIPPTACSLTVSTSTGMWNPVDNTFHYAPGHYANLPPDKDTTLDPGVYCVDNLIKTTNSFRFFADGAFMYVRPGGNFSFTGGTIQLVAPGMIFPGHATAAPVAPATQPYKGFLIYVDSNVWGDPAPDCNVNAASDTVLAGVIYAPHCDVGINGNSGTVGITAQVVGYTLDLTGGAILTFTYDPNIMPAMPELKWTGIYH